MRRIASGARWGQAESHCGRFAASRVTGEGAGALWWSKRIPLASFPHRWMTSRNPGVPVVFPSERLVLTGIICQESMVRVPKKTLPISFLEDGCLFAAVNARLSVVCFVSSSRDRNIVPDTYQW